jgi:hypothetical protein
VGTRRAHGARPTGDRTRPLADVGPADVDPAAAPAAVGAAPTGFGDRAGPPPSLVRKLLAGLRMLGTPTAELAAGFSLSPAALARLEAGEEGVWTATPLADRLRALELVGPFLFALDPDAPMPDPRRVPRAARGGVGGHPVPPAGRAGLRPRGRLPRTGQRRHPVGRGTVTAASPASGRVP